MTPKHLFILLLALFASALAQNDDELHIPVENDNQFPPEDHSESDGIITEGSGAGVIDEPIDATTEASAPLLDDVTALTDAVPTVASTEEHACPKPCVCNVEGDSNKFIVDCSGYGLTALPLPLDTKTTELNLQNNNLTSIPKDISALKDLKILNLNNNDIMEIISGSISELPELTSLKLGNNRLIEYPTDLKNSFGLTKLEELDLGGNDMRTDLKPDIFTNFKALRKVTLPSAAAELVEDLCSSLKDSLAVVCTGSCKTKSFDCPDAPQAPEEDLLDFALPGLIALATSQDDNSDPTVQSTTTAKAVEEKQETVILQVATADETVTTSTVNNSTDEIAAFSARSAIVNAPGDETKSTETASEVTKKTEAEVVGATTVNTKTGGVDKSVIGMIVAAMVVVVAAITIKKNWSSIRKRFSSSPARTANDRTETNANGTTPEEVPLQEKSPV